MKDIMIATSNEGKIKEFVHMLEPYGYQVKSLLDMEEVIDIEETGITFEENALIKAQAIHELLGIEVIADDSGLAVNCMHGEPGVYSARFLGRDTSYEVKNQYIIDQCNQAQDRGAQYVCVIAYVKQDGSHQLFKGIVEGEIAREQIGDQGFGYDPIFYYPPFQTTLANVTEDQKHSISHRGKALAMLIASMKEGK